MSVREWVSGYIQQRTITRDAVIGGGVLLVYRLGHEYIIVYRSRPDLLEHMGASLLLGLIGLLIAGVIINRLVDSISNSVGRIADSVERSAASAVDSASAQTRLAESQQAIAQSINQLAGKDDRQSRNLEVMMGTMVTISKRITRRQRAHEKTLDLICAHIGVPRTGDNNDDE